MNVSQATGNIGLTASILNKIIDKEVKSTDEFYKKLAPGLGGIAALVSAVAFGVFSMIILPPIFMISIPLVSFGVFWLSTAIGFLVADTKTAEVAKLKFGGKYVVSGEIDTKDLVTLLKNLSSDARKEVIQEMSFEQLYAVKSAFSDKKFRQIVAEGNKEAHRQWQAILNLSKDSKNSFLASHEVKKLSQNPLFELAVEEKISEFTISEIRDNDHYFNITYKHLLVADPFSKESREKIKEMKDSENSKAQTIAKKALELSEKRLKSLVINEENVKPILEAAFDLKLESLTKDALPFYEKSLLSKRMTMENIKSILEEASKYNLDGLKQNVFNILKNSLVESSLQRREGFSSFLPFVFEMAKKYDNQELLNEVLNNCRVNAEGIKNSNIFKFGEIPKEISEVLYPEVSIA